MVADIVAGDLPQMAVPFGLCSQRGQHGTEVVAHSLRGTRFASGPAVAQVVSPRAHVLGDRRRQRLNLGGKPVAGGVSAVILQQAEVVEDLSR